MCNAYSELNDPIDQIAGDLCNQLKKENLGNDLTNMMDEDYVTRIGI